MKYKEIICGLEKLTLPDAGLAAEDIAAVNKAISIIKKAKGANRLNKALEILVPLLEIGSKLLLLHECR